MNKMVEWLEENIRKMEEDRGFAGPRYLEAMTFRAVLNKLRQFDAEECCASLTMAGY